jgi:transmembrane sensor
MTPPESSLGRHIQPALDDARLARQVSAIAAAGGRRPRRWSGLLAVAAAGAAVFAVVASRSGVAPPPPAPRPPAAAAVDGETLTLADGSRAVLDPRSKLTLLTMRADLVRVELERGGVDLDVVHAEGKQLVVLARGYEIRVLGTRFTVRLGEGKGEPDVFVGVARGRVRVTRAGDDSNARLLDAGETWSAGPSATASAAPAESAPARGRAPAVAEAGESARQLLARAEAFRAADDPRAAARTLATLRARYPADPRAGLAAFELGRLRLDRLGDPHGAAQAFQDAVSIAPAAPFREDAQARLVEAYAAGGERGRCLDAQAEYLSRYPRGLHRQKVASRCPE